MKKIIITLLLTPFILRSDESSVVEFYVMNEAGSLLFGSLHYPNQEPNSIIPKCLVKPGITLQTIRVRCDIDYIEFEDPLTRDTSDTMHPANNGYYLIHYNKEQLCIIRSKP